MFHVSFRINANLHVLVRGVKTFWVDFIVFDITVRDIDHSKCDGQYIVTEHIFYNQYFGDLYTELIDLDKNSIGFITNTLQIERKQYDFHLDTNRFYASNTKNNHSHCKSFEREKIWFGAVLTLHTR